MVRQHPTFQWHACARYVNDLPVRIDMRSSCEPNGCACLRRLNGLAGWSSGRCVATSAAGSS